MTLQLRPTFSESWYRVKNLRAKLRPGAQISRQFYRGERWYVVRDPAGNQFHRLSDPAYRFIGLLNGSRTVEEAWELAGGQLEDEAPTQPEVIQILSHLFSANLIDADVTPDATVLLRRHKQLTKRKMQNRLMNVLFPRIPLWDPDRFLKLWMPVVRVLFSKLGALVWLVVIVAALAVVGSRWSEPGHSIREATAHAVDLKGNPINVVYLWAVFVFIKLIHELGHAFSCRRFGGECHELGIMFLVFIPTPYVDASTAWSFPSRWARIFVGAAGMIVELFFAALMAFVWAYTSPAHIVNQLAFNAMLVASVTTIIFNANPLLRYDGYYILSDFLEIPNLRQKSTDYAMGLIKRHIFGVKLQQPLPPPLQRAWLFVYAVASSIYRTFIGIVIILLVAYKIPVLGILMALGGVATWIIVPVFKTFKYLALEPELHRKRGRASAVTLAFAAAVVILIGFVPFPVSIHGTGYTEPTVHSVIHSEYPGFVSEIRAKDGQWLEKGQVILVAHDPQLDSELLKTDAELRKYKSKLLQSLATDPAQALIDQDSIDVVQKKLDDLKDRDAKLTIRAPLAGQLIAPDLRDSQGAFLPRGKEVAEVAQSDQLTVRILLEQAEVEPVVGELEPDMPHAAKNAVRKPPIVEIRMAGAPWAVLPGGQPQVMGAATRDLVHPSLGPGGGQDIAGDPRDPTKTQNDEFYVGVPLENKGSYYVAGQRANVRFLLDKKPLIWQWGRRFYQMIQMKSNSPWV